MSKFETIEETYRRLVKERAKTDPNFALMQEEIDIDDELKELGLDDDDDWDDYEPCWCDPEYHEMEGI